MKTLIGIPCMDMVHTGFMKSLLQLQRKEEVGFSIISSSLIYDARNTLAKHGIDGGFDRILWLDSDMEFSPDLLNHLIEDMDENNLDIVGGIYFTRKTPSMPCFYQKVGYLHDEEEDSVSPVALHYYDYPADQLFTVEGLGFGAVLVKVDLIKKVQDKYGLPFSPILGFGEDLSFCIRARDVGATIWVDSRVKCGHIGQIVYTEEGYARPEDPAERK